MTATLTHPASTYRHAAAIADGLVGQILPAHLDLPTPCSGWTVRDLLRHLIIEARWTAPLLAGLTVAEVGDRLNAELDDHALLPAWREAIGSANAATLTDGATERTVRLSSGDVPGSEYLCQLTADYVIHSWDLAVAIGTDGRLDPGLVAAVGGWFTLRENMYRDAGATGPRPDVEHDADPQTRLLAMFGRSDRQNGPAALAVQRFGAAFDRRDVDAVMAAMTADCVFEATTPPAGVRHEGQTQVRAAWTKFFAESGGGAFETEDQFSCGDRVVVRWRYTWAPGENGFVRGVDIFRTRDGLVAEKLAYVKG